jgi:hypothetical protein
MALSGVVGSRRRLMLIAMLCTAVAVAGGVFALNTGQNRTHKTRVLGVEFERATAGTANGSGASAIHAGTTLPFTITGSLNHLFFPGMIRTLQVVVHNTSTHKLHVTQITVTVGQPTNTGCLKQWVHVKNYSSTSSETQYIAPANGTVTVPVAAELIESHTNQNACKSTSVPLSFAGSGQLL